MQAPDPTLPSLQGSQSWGRERARALVMDLVDYRLDLQVPAARLAKQMGVVPEIVYRLESENRDPRLSTVFRYAKALSLDLVVVRTEIRDGTIVTTGGWTR